MENKYNKINGHDMIIGETYFDIEPGGSMIPVELKLVRKTNEETGLEYVSGPKIYIADKDNLIYFSLNDPFYKQID